MKKLRFILTMSLIILALLNMIACNNADASRSNDNLAEIEAEITNDPNRNINRSDLLGLWQSNYDSRSEHYYNIWFTDNEIYYMGSKSRDPGFDIIKAEYLIATSYTFNGVDVSSRLRKGEFYNSDLGRSFSFTVQIIDGSYEMFVSGSPIDEYFHKM